MDEEIAKKLAKREALAEQVALTAPGKEWKPNRYYTKDVFFSKAKSITKGVEEFEVPDDVAHGTMADMKQWLTAHIKTAKNRELFDCFEWEFVFKESDSGLHFTRVTDENCPVLDSRRAVTLTFTAIWKSTPGKTWSDLCKVPLGRRRYKNEDPEEVQL